MAASSKPSAWAIAVVTRLSMPPLRRTTAFTWVVDRVIQGKNFLQGIKKKPTRRLAFS
jgi:hypothetical protein